MYRIVVGIALIGCSPHAPIASTPPATAVHETAIAPAPAPPPELVPLGPLPADVHPTQQSLRLEIDPNASSFTGATRIGVHLDHPRTTIWLHGRNLVVQTATIESGGSSVAAHWEQVDPNGVGKLTVAAPVSGDVTLAIKFEAHYDPQLVGVYRTETPAGPAVFSKFEAIYARRAFPCFDEPRFKIPFEIALDVPAGAAVVANMPPASDATSGDTRHVTFAPTPALPTYLVAFAVGPFDARTTSVPPSADRSTPLPLGAIAVAGRGSDTEYALAQEPALLAEQERYFGVAFPFPKLDLVAVPDFQSGAMGNAGAITFRDSALLVDDRVTSLAQRIGIASVLAHETAHQWFGDLVTMPWWNDLWLNEGFATFLATRTLRAVRPELEAELGAVDDANNVMDRDSLASSRRIREPIVNTDDITNAFDGITYEKGAAVLGMLEHYVGVEPFRRAIHAYLVAHARGNATTDDLVAALSTEAGHDLRPLAASFLDQPGVPVIAAHLVCEHGAGRVELSQSRWQPIGAHLADQAWTVPVCVRTAAGETCGVLADRTGSIALPACADWVMLNAQAAGYYRFTLPADELAHLRDHASQLSVAERMAFAYALAAGFSSGALAGGDVLRALESLARDPHGSVARIPLDVLRIVDTDLVDASQRRALRAHVAALYKPALAALGWKPSPTEQPWKRLYRTQLIGFLALTIGDPDVLAHAAKLGRQLIASPTSTAVDPDLGVLVLAAAARTGNAKTFDALVAQLVASTDAQVRGRILGALGSVRDPALVERALALSLDTRLRQNERLNILGGLFGAIETRDAAWRWLQAHFDELVPMLPDRYAGFVPLLVPACDPARAAEVRAFFTPRIDKLTGGPRNLAHALEAAAQCAARAQAQHDSVAAYIRKL